MPKAHQENQGGVAVGGAGKGVDHIAQLLLRPQLLEDGGVHDARNQAENGLLLLENGECRRCVSRSAGGRHACGHKE